MRTLLVALAGFLWSGLGVSIAAEAVTERLALPEKAFRALYDQITGGTLDLTPFYDAAGLTVSNDVCQPRAPTGTPSSCKAAPCPMAATLRLNIACLYRQDAGINRSDLLVSGRFPVRRLGDYDPAWNTFQFSTFEKKTGWLTPIGLIRTLAFPGDVRSGFFEFKQLAQTDAGQAEVDKWKALAASSDATQCSAAFCFTVHSVLLSKVDANAPLKEVLVECVRRKIKQVEGPPEYCVPIYLEGTKGVFVSALTSFRNETMKVWRGLITSRIFFTSPKFKSVPEVVPHLVEKALAAPPLTLQTSRDPDAVVGVSAERPSAIISNWHEMVTVRAVITELPISLSAPGAGAETLPGVQVGLATTLFVNNRNTDDENEWHPPSRNQSDTFDSALVATIQAEASAECPGASSLSRDGVMVITCTAGPW